MVDPVSGSGPVQGITPAQRSQGNLERHKAEQASGTSSVQDQVEISEEALSQQQAEDVARRTALSLSGSQYALGLDPNFDAAV
ncbi:MAG: hypothetical protein LRZ85_02940 [Alphaproteobacteria bacterium]|nr:hypothetical protein [Alphaproteobacteria bacterium]MCD8520083.1 hypothetical protein [Alphaproteobacteria bacterium]MCD8526552.1 hypothetical protein [Alphaproteobacteria bacterium]MCD8571335.1 hypothetical protein [Alphaproteobacteria bacterium]